MIGSYTFDGAIEMHDYFIGWELQNGGGGYKWPATLINDEGKEPSTCGPYKVDTCNKVISKYSQYLIGKRGYVVGSMSPWAEAALIAVGAANVTTIEYMPITTDHPRLSYVHPYNLSSVFLQGHHSDADFAWSFSSLEHDGLGRYGDPISPFADFESIGRINCLLKPGGIFFLGLPVGPDAIYWNAHRIYGHLRLYPILSSWEVLDVIGTVRSIMSREKLGDWNHQPIMVLKTK